MKNQGNFFAIDSRKWSGVCDIGLNAAVAFLVLARGSGPDNRTTCWSTQAIERHAGMSRGRARDAINSLVDNTVIGRLRGGTRPRYDLSPTPPEAPQRQWIWLPNELVTGVANEVRAVELLRQGQDVGMLRLLVDLYCALPGEGSIARSAACRRYERHQVGQHGAHVVVWGFGPNHQNHAKHDGDDNLYWHRLDLLACMGLVDWLPHLFESADADAEVIHAMAIGGDESKLRIATHEAGVAMLTAEQRERVAAMDLLLAPILRHMPDVQLCDMARLRHPPRTKAVADWAEMADARATEYLQRYRAMTGRDDASAAIGADESCTKIVQEAELAVNETGTVPVDARSNRINSSQIESTKHHRGGAFGWRQSAGPRWGWGGAIRVVCGGVEPISRRVRVGV